MKTISVNCKQCNISFEKSIYEVNRSLKLGKENFFCSNKCSCLNNNFLTSKLLPIKRLEEYNSNPKTCLNCGNVISYKNKSWQKYCSRTCSATFTQKSGGRVWSNESKQKMSEWAKNHAHKIPKTKIQVLCLECNKPFEHFKSKKQLCCSKNCYYTYAKKTRLLKGKRGGYREKGGRGKQGWYKGYYCNSSWELAWVIYQLDNGKIFKRNTEGFSYIFEGESKKFYPDFIIDDEYVEIKGYHSPQFTAKADQFPHKLKILHKKDMSEYFNYTISKYGKRFTDLYEKKI